MPINIPKPDPLGDLVEDVAMAEAVATFAVAQGADPRVVGQLLPGILVNVRDLRVRQSHVHGNLRKQLGLPKRPHEAHGLERRLEPDR